jgi:hypothetical protein
VNTVTVTSSSGAVNSDTAEVDVLEPDLIIDKVVDASFVPIGESVGYTITVNHSAASSVTAYDLVIADPFSDPFLVLDPSSVTAVIVGATGLPAPVIELVGTGFRITVPELPQGASVIIGFNATAQAAATANGAASTNTATLTYDTIPGTQSPDEQRSYTADDDATVTIVGPTCR